jgi:hypothetical protein
VSIVIDEKLSRRKKRGYQSETTKVREKEREEKE